MEIATSYKDQSWNESLKDESFKIKLYIGGVLLAIVLVSFPFFFQYIEQRDGDVLNDVVLDALVARDVSVPIFTIIWATTILFLIRSIQSPGLFLTFMYGFVLLSLSRFLTIYFVPLNPPQDLIPLVDPISNSFLWKIIYNKGSFLFGTHSNTVSILFKLSSKN